MERLKDTQNYVYSLNDLVGKGATCEVYKGINKETGQVHALKIFEIRLRTIAHRELEALRSLKHDNIVEFIGEETDTATGRVVAVMEYCDKSLFNMLCEPENKYGIIEDEYMRFFKHIVEGMKHLREHDFLHRDIKPGNILLALDENGGYIYKLSDFGTAKPVLETEAFQSLVGTEEYLHPQIFKAAFIDQGMTRDFDAAADLWSLGATLYHAATGKVPFRPFHGRNDRMLMFQMIAQKEHGVIAGEQKSQAGQVVWYRELPQSCRMSRWLKQGLTEILARLMEPDRMKALTFDQFFLAAEDILGHCVVYMFSTKTAKHFRLYMKSDCVLKDLQSLIQQETNIPPKEQLIVYEESFLKDIIKEGDPLSSYPCSSKQNPLVLIQSTGEPASNIADDTHLWYIKFSLSGESVDFAANDKGFGEDVKIAGRICDLLASLQYTIDQSCLAQEVFEKTIRRTERWKEILINRLQTEVDLYRDRVKDLRHIHKAITENGGIHCLTPAEGVTMEDLKAKANSCSSYMEIISGVKTDDGRQLYKTKCRDGNKCPQKISLLLEKAKVKRGMMEQRKRCQRSMLSHEMKLHSFDKKEMSDLLVKASELWYNHCKPKIAEIHTHFLQWHSFKKPSAADRFKPIPMREWVNQHRSFTSMQTKIELLQKETRALKNAIKTYTRNFRVGTDLSLEVDSVAEPTVTVMSPVSPVSDIKTKYLADNLLHQLNYVKLGQAEMRSLMHETDAVHKQSMDLMSLDDMTTLSSDENGGR